MSDQPDPTKPSLYEAVKAVADTRIKDDYGDYFIGYMADDTRRALAGLMSAYEACDGVDPAEVISGHERMDSMTLDMLERTKAERDALAESLKKETACRERQAETAAAMEIERDEAIKERDEADMRAASLADELTKALAERDAAIKDREVAFAAHDEAWRQQSEAAARRDEAIKRAEAAEARLVQLHFPRASKDSTWTLHYDFLLKVREGTQRQPSLETVEDVLLAIEPIIAGDKPDPDPGEEGQAETQPRDERSEGPVRRDDGDHFWLGMKRDKWVVYPGRPLDKTEREGAVLVRKVLPTDVSQEAIAELTAERDEAIKRAEAAEKSHDKHLGQWIKRAEAAESKLAERDDYKRKWCEAREMTRFAWMRFNGAKARAEAAEARLVQLHFPRASKDSTWRLDYDFLLKVREGTQRQPSLETVEDVLLAIGPFVADDKPNQDCGEEGQAKDYKGPTVAKPTELPPPPPKSIEGPVCRAEIEVLFDKPGHQSPVVCLGDNHEVLVPGEWIKFRQILPGDVRQEAVAKVRVALHKESCSFKEIGFDKTAALMRNLADLLTPEGDQ